MRLPFRLEASREKGSGKVLPLGPLSKSNPCGSIWAKALMAAVVFLFSSAAVVVGAIVVVFCVFRFRNFPVSIQYVLISVPVID